MPSLTKLSLILAGIVAQPGCRTTEQEHRSESVPLDPPGYRFAYPDDLPEKCYHISMNGKRIEDDARQEYEHAYRRGWQECDSFYRLGRIKLAEPAAELTSTDWSGSQAVRRRGRHDGYEECRRWLLAGGNK